MYSWQDKDKWEDYYKILGIQRTATAAEIKSAWKKRAVKSHPDLVAEELQAAATELLKKINRAREALSNPVVKNGL